MYVGITTYFCMSYSQKKGKGLKIRPWKLFLQMKDEPSQYHVYSLIIDSIV